jgi:hypothetical protein
MKDYFMIFKWGFIFSLIVHMFLGSCFCIDAFQNYRPHTGEADFYGRNNGRLYYSMQKEQALYKDLLERKKRSNERLKELTSKLGTLPTHDKIEEGITTLENKNKLQKKEKDNLFELKEIKVVRGELADVEKKIEEIEAPPSMSQLIGAAIAGPEYIGSKMTISEGVMARSSKAIGDVIGQKMFDTAWFSLGSCWDAIVHKVGCGFEYSFNLIFHSGKQPFKQDVLFGWQMIVKTSCEEIENILSRGMQDSLRGHDMTMRKNALALIDNSLDGDQKKNQLVQEDEKLNVWAESMEVYVGLFNKLIDEIEKGKNFYSTVSMEYFYATQIQKRLMLFSKILSSTKSVSDLNNVLDSNKPLLVAIKRNVENFFNQLIAIVKPRNNSGMDQKGGISKPGQFGNRPRDGLMGNVDDNDFTPQTFYR